ncbi:hypothetical protein I4U23_015497 [Adineta vaga]|nr:hypothetical protein I4U23_015497 [Adineta vaga]
MIRGTTVRLIQRQNPTVVRRTRANASNTLSPKIRSLRLSSSQRTLTVLELLESLESWRDPEEDAQDFTAKERIKDCFEQQSESLDLSFLCLTTLPDVIGKMQHIQFLSLANNSFSELPHLLTQLTSLKLLDLSNNVLQEIPDSIKSFKNLKILNVTCNQLRKVSNELAHLPGIETVLVSHNRILQFPDNIHCIKSLEIDDQVPPAAIGSFSVEFAKYWEEKIQYEGGSGCFEIWIARFELLLQLPNIETYSEMLRERIVKLMESMINNLRLRQRCFVEANTFIGTCYDGILFSLFLMEIIQLEERIMALELSDEDVRKAIEQVYNFSRLQNLATLYARENFNELTTNEDDQIVEELETTLFFYGSPANTLDMPLDNERIRFVRDLNALKTTNDNVRKAVVQIEEEKYELGEDYLVDFVIDKEFWVNYLESRYTDIIEEHTQIFMNQLDELDTRKSEMLEYDYLVKANAIVEEKTESEQRLYYQLTRNIVRD